MRILIAGALCGGACLGQTTLRQYLSLTDPQVSTIRKLNSDYNQVINGKQNRSYVVQQELSRLFGTPNLDPRELGVRYVELEMIRRDEAAQLSAEQKQVQAALNPAQMTAVQNLGSAVALSDLARDAGCAYLADTPTYGSHWFDTSSFALLSFSVNTGNPFPYFPLPYIPPAPTGTFCGSATFPASVRDFLSLTDAQVAGLFAASAAYNDFYLRQQNRMNDLNVEIRDISAQDAPDPVQLGLRYAELARIGSAITAMGAQLRDSARGLLTPAQSAKLKTLQDTVAARDVIQAAQGCGLLIPAPSGNSPNYSLYCSL